MLNLYFCKYHDLETKLRELTICDMNITVLNTCLNPSLLFIVGSQKPAFFFNSQRMNCTRSRGCLQLAVPNMWLVQKKKTKWRIGSWDCKDRIAKETDSSQSWGLVWVLRIRYRSLLGIQSLAKQFFEVDSGGIRKISFFRGCGVYQP